MSEYDGGDFPDVNPQSVLRTLSSEDLAQTNQHWFGLVVDILKKNTFCHTDWDPIY